MNSSYRILCAEKDEDYGASLNVIAEFQRSSNGLAATIIICNPNLD